MSQATDILRHEHEAILIALEILEHITSTARDGKAKSDDIPQFLGFLREFADTCHHGKEEGFLFPAMIEAGLPPDSGPISVMLSEHRQGRELLGAMVNAVEPVLKLEEFCRSATAYVALMRSHIGKENNVLFPMADRMIAPGALDGLAPAFERHEEEVMGAGRHEQLHKLLEELRIRYPGS